LDGDAEVIAEGVEVPCTVFIEPVAGVVCAGDLQSKKQLGLRKSIRWLTWDTESIDRTTFLSWAMAVCPLSLVSFYDPLENRQKKKKKKNLSKIKIAIDIAAGARPPPS